MEVGTADAFLRFEVAMTDILPRRAGFGAGDRRATPFYSGPQTVAFAKPAGQHWWFRLYAAHALEAFGS